MDIKVPLSKLSLAKENVRRDRDDAGIDEVIATIKARGLLQNLGVIAARKKGCYEVVYGGRRLRALQLMATRGELDGGTAFEVACKVRDKATAFEDSLAENVTRLAMHPLDECAAFRRLVEQGSDEASIAERWGITPRQVAQRLRLAGLATDIADAYRRRQITLDIAQAYATTADQALQTRIFEQHRYYRPAADAIRREIAQAGVAGDHRLALFVGRAAYEAAGGVVEDALFTDQITFRDRELLERLAEDKAAADAAALREALGVAEVRVGRGGYGGVGHDETRDLKYVETVHVPLVAADQTRYDELSARYNELTGEGERDSDELDDDEQAELERISAEIDALDASTEVVDPAEMTNAVAFVVIDADGQLSRYRQLFVPKNVPVPTTTDNANATPASDVPVPAKPFAESAQLAAELADQRGQILAASLAQSPALAADVLAFAVACGVLGTYRARVAELKLALTARTAGRAVHNIIFDTTAAAATLRQIEEGLELGWLALPRVADQFAGFQALSDGAKSAIVAVAVARMVEPTVNTAAGGDRRSDFHELLAALMGIDAADWWRPTSANYWDRATKAVMLEALDDFGGNVLRGRYASEKKGALSATMEQLCAGAAIVEPEVKARALAYVPPIMQFGSASDAANHPAGDSEDGITGTADSESIDDGAIDTADEGLADDAETIDDADGTDRFVPATIPVPIDQAA